MKHIGLLTSGGDAPGMNACIRSVVRSANYYGIKVSGVYRGFQGLIEDDLEEMDSGRVSGIIFRGGTILRSARCPEFHKAEMRALAADHLRNRGIEALVVIGGDGSFRGALALEEEQGIATIGIPGTIDNDLYGTDSTLGYDTAVNTVIQAVDKIKDTAESHHRLFIVEVMGRDAGFIALRSGIATGAEAILVPETVTDVDKIVKHLKKGWNAHKYSALLIVAEGDEIGGAYEVRDLIRERVKEYDIRVTVLGHIQRGGSPSAYDRVLASRLGLGAIKALKAGVSKVMIGERHKDIVHIPLEQATKHHQGMRSWQKS
jgi:6-phosphofructokinase 1